MKRIVMICFVLLCLTPRLLAQGKSGLRPDFLQLQYAGSVGFFSFGAGYDVFKDHAILSAQFGHVPSNYGGPLNIFSTRLLFVPGRYSVGEKVTVSPFDIGLMVSYHLGSNFRTRWPTHRYPENYYWWQTSFRLHLDYQPSVTIKLRDHTIFKFLTVYLDFNANELYLISYLQNRHALSVADVMKLGSGIRLHY